MDGDPPGDSANLEKLIPTEGLSLLDALFLVGSVESNATTCVVVVMGKNSPVFVKIVQKVGTNMCYFEG